MQRPRPALLLALALAGGVLVVKVPETAPTPTPAVDASAYVQLDELSREVTVLDVPTGPEDEEATVERITGAEVLQTRPLSELVEGEGFQETGTELTLERVATPLELQEIAEELGETSAGTRFAVSARLVVPLPEDAGNLRRRVNESIGVDGAGMVETYHLTERADELEVQPLGTLPPGVRLEDVVSALAEEFELVTSEIDILPGGKS